MGFSLALLICSIGIAGLFVLDRDKSVRNSRAMWAPVIWLWLIGSRPPSAWLGMGPVGSGLDATLEGNSTDALVYALLVIAGIVILLRRRRSKSVLAENAVVLVYFGYCLLSIVWSPFPDAAFKRWIKAIGDVVMVFVLVTDPQPVMALRRLFSRIGFILLPASILLIRYSSLGRGFDPDGNPANIGVTTNKNVLGLISFLVALGAVWNLYELLGDKRQRNRGRRLLAQTTLLLFGLALLQIAHSATAVACFLLGAALILVTNMRRIRRRPVAVHAVIMLLVLAGGVAMLAGADEDVVHALGRETNLTGRTDIWKAALPLARNPIIGAGFESFWNSVSGEVTRNLPGFYGIGNLNSAHNGYIEIYLNLGWIGVCLIALILITGYRYACRSFRADPAVGSLMLAYIACAAMYSITEAGFRTMNPMWVFLLLGTVGARSIATKLEQRPSPAAVLSREPADSVAPGDALAPLYREESLL